MVAYLTYNYEDLGTYDAMITITSVPIKVVQQNSSIKSTTTKLLSAQCFAYSLHAKNALAELRI